MVVCELSFLFLFVNELPPQEPGQFAVPHGQQEQPHPQQQQQQQQREKNGVGTMARI